jgi:NADPH:quinone reductase
MSMRAISCPSYGPIEQLAQTELPVPEPGPGQVRVRVHASAINPADHKSVTGSVKILHGRSFPMVVGYDYSGVVDALGPGVTAWAPGDEVFGFLPYGGSTKSGAFAELLVASATAMAKKPAAISHGVAAAAATPALTALQAMLDAGRLGTGGRVLLIGASGGVGAVAIGVALKLGASVTAVCATHAVDFVTELGPDEVIDRSKQDPLKTARGPFDVVFDAAAAHGWSTTKQLLGPGGAYVTTLPSLAFFGHKLASLFSATRCSFIIVKPKASDLEQLARWLGEGLKVPIESTVPVREVKTALARMMKGQMRGRIVVQVEGGFA